MHFSLIELTTLDIFCSHLRKYTNQEWKFSLKSKQKILHFLKKGEKFNPHLQEIRTLARTFFKVWVQGRPSCTGFLLKLKTRPELSLYIRLVYPKLKPR
jgi:hypothetical protein